MPVPSRTCLAEWGWFCTFAAIGAGAALGSVSLGPLALVPAVLVAALMLSRTNIRRSAFGLLSGAGFLLLYVAWVQRDGPGTTCWHTAIASGCDQHLNPLPWLLPDSGGRSIFSLTHGTHSLAPAPGFALFAGCCLLALAIAAVLLIRRDT